MTFVELFAHVAWHDYLMNYEAKRSNTIYVLKEVENRNVDSKYFDDHGTK